MLIKTNRYHYDWYDENTLTTHPIGSFDLFERKNSNGEMEMWSFGIKKDENRGKGYGQRMLHEALLIANGRPVRLYVYKTNAPAIHIYQKAGFRIIGKYMGNDALVLIHDGNAVANTKDHREESCIC